MSFFSVKPAQKIGFLLVLLGFTLVFVQYFSVIKAELSYWINQSKTRQEKVVLKVSDVNLKKQEDKKYIIVEIKKIMKIPHK